MGGLLAKINVWDIVAGHFKTFVYSDSELVKKGDYFVFYALPAFPLALMVYRGVQLTDTAISVLVTALSILAGLLFNLLVLMHSLEMPQYGEPMDSKLRKLLEHLHVNIAYAVVVSLVTLLPLAIGSYFAVNATTRSVLGYLAVYLCIHFGFTMCMILKRMDTLLMDRLRETHKQRNARKRESSQA